MKISKEYLAEKYAEEENSAYTNDYYGFINGWNSSQKQNKKRLRDKYNHLNSLLRDEKYIKLTKILNTEKINKLQIEVNLLKQLTDGK